MHKDSSPCYFLGPHNYGSHQQSWWQYSPDPSRCCEDDNFEIQMVDCFIMRMLNWQLVQCLLSCLAPLQYHSISVFFVAVWEAVRWSMLSISQSQTSTTCHQSSNKKISQFLPKVALLVKVAENLHTGQRLNL